MLISIESARQLCLKVFSTTMGAPDDIAEAATESLVDASLRGIDSHGILILPYYLGRWTAGQIVPSSRPKIVRETGVTTVFDGCQAMGHYTSRTAMQTAIERAKDSGMGAAVARNSTHNGAISLYSIQAARQGMIGIAATACAPHVAPFGGTSGLHGTNPITYAFPRKDQDPLVFDLSTGYSSAKIKDIADRDGRLPPDRVLDSAGKPTTDPADKKDGWILPVAGHIGFGLGLLVDGLACALSDGPIGREIPLVSDKSGAYNGSFFAMAIAPAAFAGTEAFEQRIGSLVGQIEDHRPQDLEQPVRWPGQRGWTTRRTRSVEGIPVSDQQWQNFRDGLKKFDVEP